MEINLAIMINFASRYKLHGLSTYDCAPTGFIASITVRADFNLEKHSERNIATMKLPYRAEYAKGGRSSCKECKSTIKKDTLRLAVTAQLSQSNGKIPNWYHFKCFFDKQRPKSVDDIKDFESLRCEDQKEIKEKVEASGNDGVVLRAKRGKKRGAPDEVVLEDYTIKYAKLGRAECRGCYQKILKDEVRVSKKNYESDDAKRYGLKDMWHHLSCFAKLRSELGYFADADALPGFNSLKKDDQERVKKHLPPMKQKDLPEIKRTKKEKYHPIEKEIEDQNKIMLEYRDQLKKELTKKELGLLLKINKQDLPTSKENMLDRVADIMTFGTLEPCKNCGNGQLVFKEIGYVCQRYSSNCAAEKIPKRRAFAVPKELLDHPFLKKYKYIKRIRAFRGNNPTDIAPLKKDDEETESKLKMQRETLPLYEMKFVILGKPPRGKDIIKKEVVRLGGKVVIKVKNSVMAIISTPDEIKKNGLRMQEARSSSIQVVSEDFLDLAEKYAGRIPILVKKKSIVKWGSNPKKRLPPEPTNHTKSKGKFLEYDIDELNITVGQVSAVDPDCQVAHIAHIDTHRGDIYNVLLGSIEGRKMIYYRLQLLCSDWGSSFWIFRSWGQLYTKIKEHKLELMNCHYSALCRFEKLYLQKTGNRWENRDDFVRIPGKMYPVGVACGAEDQDVKLKINTQIYSKLPQPIQDLMKLIFDIDAMKKVMLEFGLKTEYMFIGNLCKNYIQQGYRVLAELQKLIDDKASEVQLKYASNRFYVLVAHSFDAEGPPIITDAETIKKKIEILNNLEEIEAASEVMYSSGDNRSVDAYYEKLRTDIEVLDVKTEEFSIIEEYVKKTQSPTRDQYDLEIVHVFKIKRHGESDRFKLYSNLPNRKLLWYGSRKTNFVGILSQGLRIPSVEAPEESIGKCIYFSDLVSKSANDCCTNSTESTGLMLLCEVALGDIFESIQPRRPLIGSQSCKIVGRTQPNSSVVRKINDIEVPLGEPTILDGPLHSRQLYNEYIVHDAAQVNIKYLVQMNFKYK